MNGYGHFEKLNEYFSTDRIYGGTALIGAYVYGPGDFNFTGGVHAKAMNLCAYADDVTDEVRKHEQALYEDFATATLNPTIVDNFIGMCMAKIVFNSVLNTLCTMYQIRFGEFHAHPDARWLTEQLVDEPTVRPKQPDTNCWARAKRKSKPFCTPRAWHIRCTIRPCIKT